MAPLCVTAMPFKMEKAEASVLEDEPKKESDPGIIYLSRIPPFMSVKKIRQIFTEFGPTGRIFLQPDEKTPKGKKARLFTEGWVEYLDKKLAKRVAISLNNTQVGGKRRSRWFEEIWTMKYLPKFKWAHLNERLAYEKAVYKQRMRTEISQVKNETNFYIKNVEKNNVWKRLEKKNKPVQNRPWDFKQKDTEDDILTRKRKTTDSSLQRSSTKSQKVSKKPGSKKAADNKSFLRNIFSGGADSD